MFLDGYANCSSMDIVSLHRISKIFFAQWCSYNIAVRIPLFSPSWQRHFQLSCEMADMRIPLDKCRTWLSQVASFNDCYFDACPSLGTRSLKCLCVSFFQITVLTPSLCSCLNSTLNLTFSSLFRYPNRVCDRAKSWTQSPKSWSIFGSVFLFSWFRWSLSFIHSLPKQSVSWCLNLWPTINLRARDNKKDTMPHKRKWKTHSSEIFPQKHLDASVVFLI